MAKKKVAFLTAKPVWSLSASYEDVAPQQPTFHMEAYSGGRLDLPGWDIPVVVDLTGLDCSDQERPMLLSHKKTEDGIAGYSISVINNGRTVEVSGKLLSTTKAGQTVAAAAKEGYPWEASIGLLIFDSQTIASGQDVEVNGQRFTGPLELVRKGRLREVSFCVLGADGRTSVEIAASAFKEEIMTFEEWLASLNMDASTLSEAQVSELRKAFDAMTAAAPPTPAEAEGGEEDPEKKVEGEGDTTEDPEKPKPTEARAQAGGRTLEASGTRQTRALRNSAAAELDRQARIKKACGGNLELEAQAVREGWSPDRTRVRVLEAQAPSWASSRGRGDNNWDNRALALEAAVCRAGGMTDASLERNFQPRVLEAAASRELRGVTLGQVVGEFVNAHGGYVRPGRLGREDIAHAMQINHRVVEAAGGFTSVSLPGILGNAANKLLLDAYQSVDSPVPLLAAEVDTPDFREFKSFRLTANGEIQPLGPDGELKSIRLQEEEYANQIATNGAILTLPREMMENDDLQAFAAIPVALGRAAIDKLILTVIKLKLANALKGGGQFYTEDNKNLLTGAGSALGLTALDAAVAAFWEMKDANGVPLLMNPAQLVVPPALKGLADRIRVLEMLNETTIAGKASPAKNNYAGQFDVVTNPYFSTAFNSRNGGNGSNTRWWLEVKPTQGAAPIQVAYLKGQRTPIIEQREAAFNVLGMQWRVIFDFGVAWSDKRTSVQNNGG